MAKTSDKKKLSELEKFALEEGAYRAKAFPATQVVVDERVRLKCQIPLCPHYGHTLTCPPNVPTVEEFSRALANYKTALLVQTRSSISGEAEDYDKEEVLKYVATAGKKSKKGGEESEALKELDDMKAAAIRLHLLVNKVESKAMALGYPYALGLIGGECMLCTECVGQGSEKPCRRPYQARPSMEGIGVDVYLTCKKAGLPFDMPPKREVVWSGLILVD